MRFFKPRMGLLLLTALPLLVWTPASLGQDPWLIQGNDDLDEFSFLGSQATHNDFVSFKTNGLERMRIFESDGLLLSDVDGVVQIYTNLHLKPDAAPFGANYSGDLIMHWGRWFGRNTGATGTGDKAGFLEMEKGNLTVMEGEFSVTNEDGLVFQTIPAGANATHLNLNFADYWVEAGDIFIGGKPGNPTQGLATNYDLFVSQGRIYIGDREPVTSGGLGPMLTSGTEAALRIDAYGNSGFGTDANHHVVFIRSYNDPNNASDTPDGLAIQLDSLNQAVEPLTGPKNNYITFYDSDGNARGAIQGILLDSNNPPLPGVTYESGGADFAEYLEKMDPAEVFQVGEIVGIFAGKVSKVTQGADHILVITGAPVVLGNAPQPALKHLYGRVAFLGQVPVLVAGEVTAGDYILPSGLNDGTGIAVSPEEIQLADLPAIVGTAWSTSNGGYVNTALGFKAINWGQIIQTKVPANDEMDELIERVGKLEQMLDRLTGRQPAGGNF